MYWTRWVDYETDGTRWLRIELAAQQKDCYKGQDAVPEEYYQGVLTGLSGDEESKASSDMDEEASGNLMSNATTYTATDTGGTKRATEEEDD